MNVPPPRFLLASVYEDGSSDPPQIVPLSELPGDVRSGRRGFLRAGVSAAAILGAIGAAGCAREPEADPPRRLPAGIGTGQPAPPTPSPTPLSAAQPAQEVETAAEETTADETAYREVYAHAGPVLRLAFAAHGLLASAGADGTVKLWQLPEGARLRTLHAHRSGVADLAVTPDGRTLITGDHDGRLRVWDLSGGAPPRPVAAQHSDVGAVAASRDGTTLASGGTDGAIRIWTLPAVLKTRVLRTSGPTPRAIALSPDGGWLAFEGSYGHVRLENLKSRTSTELPEGLPDTPNALAFRPDGSLLAAAAGRELRFYAMPLGTRLGTGTDPNGSLACAAFSADGAYLATGGANGTLRLWGVPGCASATERRDAHDGAIHAIAVSPDGRFLATAGEDRKIKIWTLPDLRFHTALIDLKATPPTARGSKFTSATAEGRVVTYTQPCGSPVPAGATCTCNCVGGAYVERVEPVAPPRRPARARRVEPVEPDHAAPPASEPYSGGGSYSICTCNQVCICLAV